MISHNILILSLFNRLFFPALTFDLERILRHLVFGHVDNSVDIEGDLLGVRGPALVAEAVVVLAVRLCGEGVVVGGNGLLEVLAVSQGILDLLRPGVSVCSHFGSFLGSQISAGLVLKIVALSVSRPNKWQCHHRGRREPPSTQNTQHLGKTRTGTVHTQKSISRFPLPPNSRSPTWKVTVMTSSRCSDSWKHSRE